mmetsp:Transcript_145926/g.254747  ORF Transcript_145926/g.254747 Transcript_145926/m.254747 type:complete len:251 (-) Transcript_145926:366-1118(-)
MGIGLEDAPDAPWGTVEAGPAVQEIPGSTDLAIRWEGVTVGLAPKARQAEYPFMSCYVYAKGTMCGPSRPAPQCRSSARRPRDVAAQDRPPPPQLTPRQQARGNRCLQREAPPRCTPPLQPVQQLAPRGWALERPPWRQRPGPWARKGPPPPRDGGRQALHRLRRPEGPLPWLPPGRALAPQWAPLRGPAPPVPGRTRRTSAGAAASNARPQPTPRPRRGTSPPPIGCRAARPASSHVPCGSSSSGATSP